VTAQNSILGRTLELHLPRCQLEGSMRLRVEQLVTPFHSPAVNFKNGSGEMPCKWGECR